MTTWTPELAKFSGPRYAAIANALAADVSAGRLKPGDRLPPHRELAWRLKVTVGTVTRAYTEAERRGLIAGEVGRGTFVRDQGGGDVHVPPTASQGANFIDLSRAVPADDANNRTVAAQFYNSILLRPPKPIVLATTTRPDRDPTTTPTTTPRPDCGVHALDRDPQRGREGASMASR